MQRKKEAWGSRIGLVLAAAASAVGLGNFLRFPIQAIENGGGAFLIPYIVCFFVMGLPLLYIEWSIGRLGARDGVHSSPFMINTLAKGRLWKYVAALGIFTNITIAAFYCYVESWTLSYTMHSLIGTFSGKSQLEVAQFFKDYVNINISTTSIPYESVVFYILCLTLNVYIISKGLKGIEKAVKIAMPALLIFGALLAIRGWTLGDSGATVEHPEANAWDGLNFFWTIQFHTIWDPKVWLAAAGQIFFSISVGLGTIFCYASYMDAKKDLALNATSSGFTNEFVEVILGSAIVIPIASGYLGIDWVKENAGFGIAFQTMPYLFQQWGPILAPLSGFLWFGLLFFAGITSSISMGAPWMGLFQNEFQWSRSKSAWSFGAVTLVIGLPTVLFFNQGVFDEYDYWSGTVSLVILALLEVILFVWVLGIDKGWKEINLNADLQLPKAMKYIIQYVTPYLLLFILLGAVFTPLNNDWNQAFDRLISGQGWTLDNSSLIKNLTQSGLREQMTQNTDPVQYKALEEKMFYTRLARILLFTLFIFVCIITYRASKKTKEKSVL